MNDTYIEVCGWLSILVFVIVIAVAKLATWNDDRKLAKSQRETKAYNDFIELTRQGKADWMPYLKWKESIYDHRHEYRRY
jgi:hypothetical protein